MNLELLFAICLVQTYLIQLGYGERTKDQMYEHFNGRNSCFRRLNATHQIGCSSKRGGSTGIIHFVENESDLAFIIKEGSAGDYMPVLPTHFLTPAMLQSLKNVSKISGIVVYNDTNKPLQHYSHETVCPNSNSNLEKTCDSAWNKYGTGILYEDLPFPIYYVDKDADLKKIKDCFQKFNNFSYDMQYARSLCSVEINTFMHATIDTPTCIRRSNSKANMNPVKFCDPLGGDNIWGTLFPIQNNTRKNDVSITNKKYIVVAARLDTTSLFFGAFPGAVSPITGIVTLLSTADYLKQMVRENNGDYDKNVLFLLINGESYDYIGSQRLVYDMEKGEFPMKIEPDAKYQLPLVHLEDISLFIELSHLTLSKGLYVHLSDNKPQIKDFYNKLRRHNHFIKMQQLGVPLPPASLQSFLKAKPNISGLILADYGLEYTDKFYNSIYDNVSNINYHYYNISKGEESEIPFHSIQRHTANISEILALSLYEEITLRNYTGVQKPRLELIDELYNCYLLDRNCKVHQVVQQKDLRLPKNNNYGFYVSVTDAPNLLTYAIGLTLGWLIGDVVTVNKVCKNDPEIPMYQYFNMSKSMDDLNTTLCYRTSMNFTEAVSPAFIITDYDWKSGKYSSWSESTWKDLSVRMFLKPSVLHERFTIAVGSITFVMSMLLVYFAKSRSHILFATPENCSPTDC